MIDFTKPLQTRNGRKVRILYTDRDHPGAPIIVGLVDEQRFATWDKNGSFYGPNNHELDLVNVPEKRVGWINVYPDQRVDRIHPTKVVADCNGSNDRIGCVKIEYEV